LAAPTAVWKVDHFEEFLLTILLTVIKNPATNLQNKNAGNLYRKDFQLSTGEQT
jgi:hypothetical protein